MLSPFTLFLSLFVLCIPLLDLKAEQLSTLPVLALHQKSYGNCGSAVLLHDGIVVTASHIAHEWCRQGGQCEGINAAIFEDSSHPLHFEEVPKATVLFDSPALDLLILHIPSFASLQSTTLTTSPLSDTSVLRSIGFRQCKEKVEGSGKILRRSVLFPEVSNRGLFGESGGAILTEEGKLAGIILGARGSVQATLGHLIGRPFELRILRAAAIEPFIRTSPPLDSSTASLIEEAFLLQWYKEDVLPLEHGLFQRMGDGIQFLESAEKALRSVHERKVSDPMFLALLSSYGYPSIAAVPSLPALFSFAYALESKGAFHALGSALEPPPEIRFESLLYRKMLEKKFLGWFTTEALLILLAPLMLIWAWTMGGRWARSSQGFLGKLLLCSTSLIFWPFSALLWRALERGIRWWKKRRVPSKKNTSP